MADGGDGLLPGLREDLRLIPGAPDANGQASWLISDPVKHRFIQIDIEAHAIFHAWGRARTQSELRALLLAETGRDIGASEIAALVRFAQANELIDPDDGGWRDFTRRALAAKPNWAMWLVHNYLFVKIPLLRPDAFLARTARFVAPLYTRGFALVWAVITLIGLYLVSRQFDAFLRTFPHFFSLGGAALYVVTLAVVKTCHEMGHAYTAARYKCRVPTMGVAFLVMAPMLYCDVTDAWKLTRRRERIAIDAAGMAAEFILAGFATFLWAFLPDGGLRSAAFLVATTSWVASVAINLSPFMRFDGYYLLSDMLGVGNLQSRAFALGRWRLREMLFGLGAKPPDRLSPELRRGLILYAWAIWIYRLVVFFGIALLVYHYFFKALGVLLFIVEIGWFIAKPIADEVQAWWSMRNDISRQGRTFVSLGVASLAAAVFVVPWSGRVEAPAQMEPKNYERLFAPGPAQIAAVHMAPGQAVAAGDLLIALQSPKIEHEASLARTRLALINARLARRAADGRDRGDSLSLETELAMTQEKLAGLAREQAQLAIRAPHAGRVAEVNPDLNIGRWIARDEELGILVEPGPMVARGYLSEEAVARVDVGATGSFVGDFLGQGAQPLSVADIAYAGAAKVDIPSLASAYGGPIAVRETLDHALIPETGLYLVTMDLPADADGRVSRGTAVIAGRRESMAARFWRQIARVLVRETGA